MQALSGEVEHFQYLDLRDSEIRSLAADPRSEEKIKALISASTYATLIVEDKIIAIIGYYELWPGVIEVWVFPSIHIPDHAVSYLRCAKRYTKSLWRDLPIHRMQTSAINDELHEKWLTFLGFEKEGIMKSYTADGQDYGLWSITKWPH
jgi:hypothetical protein